MELRTVTFKRGHVDIDGWNSFTHHKPVRINENDAWYKADRRRLALLSSNSLQDKRPDLVDEWHVSFNDGLTTKHIYSTAKLRVWWQCPVVKQHIYLATVHQRVVLGNGCNICCQSSNEKAVHVILNQLEIPCKYNACLAGARADRSLRFDFVLQLKSNIKAVIEIDGNQHFKPVQKFRGNSSPVKKFLQQRINDEIKDKFVEKNKIPLLRISVPQKLTIKRRETIQFIIKRFIQINHQICRTWISGTEVEKFANQYASIYAFDAICKLFTPDHAIILLNQEKVLINVAQFLFL